MGPAGINLLVLSHRTGLPLSSTAHGVAGALKRGGVRGDWRSVSAPFKLDVCGGSKGRSER